MQEVMGLATDPMGDVEGLLLDASQAGVDRRRSSVVSYFVQFGERPRWERAVQAAVRGGWVTEAYSNGDYHVVRLSREGRVTAQRLCEERKQLRSFARKFDGRWEALTLEQLSASTYWDKVADGVRGGGPAAEHRQQRPRKPEQARAASVVAPIRRRAQIDGRRVRRAS